MNYQSYEQTKEEQLLGPHACLRGEYEIGMKKKKKKGRRENERDSSSRREK